MSRLGVAAVAGGAVRLEEGDWGARLSPVHASHGWAPFPLGLPVALAGAPVLITREVIR